MTTSRSIALTMRATVAPATGEARDALAADWPRFLRRGLPRHRWLPVPNAGQDAVDFVQGWDADALILTGGDDWGAYPHRDETERLLFQWAVGKRLPVIGVCRGAQVINRLMGGACRPGPVEVHVANTHLVTMADGSVDRVNSFHATVIAEEDLAPGLSILARAADGTVEAFSTPPPASILGLVWHPEREEEVRERDVRLMERILEGGNG
jgi:putative glutamine amidotransferase